GVRKYRALISQSGTSAPTAVVLENSLGGTVAFTRIGTGQYRLTLTGAFPENRTLILPNSVRDANSADVAACYRVDDNTVALNTGTQGGAFADGMLSSRPVDVEILVYPTPRTTLLNEGYLYRALLTQSGITAPRSRTLDNSFPAGPVWSYDAPGDYFAPIEVLDDTDGVLIFSNSIIEATSLNQAGCYFNPGNLSVTINAGTLRAGDLTAGDFADAIFSTRPLDISVWDTPKTEGESAGILIYRAFIMQSG